MESPLWVRYADTEEQKQERVRCLDLIVEYAAHLTCHFQCLSLSNDRTDAFVIRVQKEKNRQRREAQNRMTMGVPAMAGLAPQMAMYGE